MTTALAGLVILGARPAQAGSKFLEQAISAYENFEYEAALRKLEAAGGDPALAPEGRARILMYQGLIHFTLGDRQLAEREFASAIELEHGIRLPQDTSPKIIRAFEAVRATIPAPEAQKPDPPPDGTKPPRQPPPATGQSAGRSQGRIWTWVAIGVGGAALAGGGAFAGLAARAKSDFDDAEWAPRAATLKDTVQTRAMAANILFGVGGAALITGVVLFFVEDGRAPEPAGQSAVSISPGPLSVQATVRF